MNGFGWDQRIERATELADAYPFASAIVGFYRQIVSFQRGVYERLRTHLPRPNATEAHSCELDYDILLPEFRSLLNLVGRIAPGRFADSATALAHQEHRWAALLSSYWEPERHGWVPAAESEVLLVRALIQPFAESLAAQGDTRPGVAGNSCPFCGEPPVVGVLRREGDGAKRSLVCSLCATEWEFRRVLCPQCGEENKDKLPVYIAADFEHVHVEACDTCRTYLKSVDLTRLGRAVPVVDELATVPLNVWAEEHGYTKANPNILGM
jgi:FdhE protein